MPLQIVLNDLTTMRVDAIVNAANNTLLGGGGVDGCIHRSAGPELLEECRMLGGCKTGQAKITRGYRLPCRYVIHTVGPVWHGGQQGEREMLASCYRTSLSLAATYGCETVAFPLISSGAFGYPRGQALRVAVETISAYLLEQEMTVYLVIFDRSSFELEKGLFKNLSAYIDERLKRGKEPSGQTVKFSAAMSGEHLEGTPVVSEGLAEAVGRPDESFSQMVLRKIDQQGISDVQCYRKANVDRKLFSKIQSDPQYKPSKSTAMAFAVALELPLEEVRELAGKAGFSFSHASRCDMIVEYFISQGNYNIYEINEALFAFDQALLGA